MDQIKAFTLLLLFAGLSVARKSNPLAGEAEKLAAFVKGHIQEFSPIDHELDPIHHETPRDLFILTDELEVGGEVGALTFTGFSKFDNLDVEVLELNIPPEKLYGSFLLDLDIPAVITGHQKLNGVYRENGTEILFGGEGSWTISAKALHRDEHFLREEPEGFIHQYQFSMSLKLENPTLDMPGLFGEDVPAAVIDAVLDQITNEIWNIYERELEEEMWLAIRLWPCGAEMVQMPLEVALKSFNCASVLLSSGVVVSTRRVLLHFINSYSVSFTRMDQSRSNQETAMSKI